MYHLINSTWYTKYCVPYPKMLAEPDEVVPAVAGDAIRMASALEVKLLIVHEGMHRRANKAALITMPTVLACLTRLGCQAKVIQAMARIPELPPFSPTPVAQPLPGVASSALHSATMHDTVATWWTECLRT